MNDLISRKAALALARRVTEYDEGGWDVTYLAVPVEELEKQDTINSDDLRPHGRWYWADDGYCRCSECHQKCASYEHEEALEARMTNYCPSCGARMDKEDA